MKYIPNNIDDLLTERIEFGETINAANNSIKNYYILSNFKYLQRIAKIPEDREFFIRGVKDMLHNIIMTAVNQIDDYKDGYSFELFDYNEQLVDSMRKIWRDLTGHEYWMRNI